MRKFTISWSKSWRRVFAANSKPFRAPRLPNASLRHDLAPVRRIPANATRYRGCGRYDLPRREYDPEGRRGQGLPRTVDRVFDLWHGHFQQFGQHADRDRRGYDWIADRDRHVDQVQ